VKPSKTIRIAFLGASTTINHPNFPFSYPERVVYWLNRFAQANHFDVRFEVLNSGREGLTSQDVTAIVRDELLPLDPDLAVYYEGANEFLWVLDLISPHIPARKQVDPQETTMIHKVPELIRSHSAVGNLLDQALTGFGNLGEPPKPAYQLNWPGKVNESDPAVDGENLPAAMLTIVKDLDSIRASMSSIGGQFALCSFVWMVKDGMRLSPRHRYIYEHLNTVLWPLRYRDIRRLADFQNRVFRLYAADRRVPFLDVAARMPMDPQLYVDSIHMTDAGERTKAWIAFQQLVPLLRPQIENGSLPRHREHLPSPPALVTSTMRNQCEVAPTGRLYPVDSAVSLDAIDTTGGGASLTSRPPFVVTTALQQWTHAASLPLNAPPGLHRPVYLLLRGRVLSGQIGYVVEDANGETQVHKSVGPTAAAADIYVPVPSPDTAKSVVIQNDAERTAYRLEIERVFLLASSPTPPEELIRKIDLRQVRAESGALETQGDKLQVTTRDAQWGYAARVSLGLRPDSGAGLRVHVWLRTIEGKTGVGIVNDSGQVFLVTRTIRPAPRTVEIVLPIPSPPIIGDLIVRNDAAGVASKAVIERIEIKRAGLP